MFYGQCWKCGERWGIGTVSTCTCEPEQERVMEYPDYVSGIGWRIVQPPTQRPWVGLTDEEIDDLSRTMVKGNKSVNWLCQAIEAKLKEKNE